jgi:2,3-bisphosphoglycerate-dependent phosphoglycerate mutase
MTVEQAGDDRGGDEKESSGAIDNSGGTGENTGSLGASFGVPAGVRRVFAPTDGSTRIVLVRHGEAVCNVSGIVGGMLGCTGLTDLGRRQVSALAERLAKTGELAGATALYASTLPRAVETAQFLQPVVGDGTCKVVQDRELSELFPGEADGLGWQEVVDRFGSPEWDTDPDLLIAPGGESWSGFIARSSGAVHALAEGHPGQQLVAAVHAGVIESTMIAFLQMSPEASRRGWARIVHASLTEWEWVPTQSRWILIRFNDACGIPTV